MAALRAGGLPNHTEDMMSFQVTVARALALAAFGAAALAAPRDAGAQRLPERTGVVRGVVREEDGTPIAAVRVRVAELHREEQTHTQGTFLLTLPAGRWTVSFHRLGFRPENRQVTIVGDDTTELRVTLQPAVLQLQATVVTGQLSEREGRDALSPTDVRSGAELDRGVDGTVAASLRGEAGVSIASTGPATARPVIRGMGGDRILVLEDGQRPGDLSSTSGDHAVAIDPLTAKQMEVVRGPMSLLYGPSALGGVVNVVRDEVPTSLPDHAHGSLSMQGTSVNRGGTVGAVASMPLAGLAFRAEGSYRDAGDTRTPVGVMNNTEVTGFGGALGVAKTGDRGHAGFSYRYFDNDYGIPGGFAGAEQNGVDISMRRHTLRGEGELHREGKRFPKLRATAIGSDYAHQEIEESGEIATDFRQKVVASDVLAQHGGAGPVALGAFGGRVQVRDVTTGGELKTPSTRDWSAAGFVVEELGHGPVKLQVGARYDVSRFTPQDTGSITVGTRVVPVRERTFAAASGAAAILWQPRGDVRIGTSVGRAFRTPDFNELYTNGPHLAAYSYDVGDPSLRQETGIGVDAFARLDRERVRLEVAAFRNAMKNFISPSSRGRAVQDAQGRPIFQYTNEDARFMGAEGSLEASLTRRVVVDGTLSYVQAEFTNDRADIPVFTDDGAGGIDTTFVQASRYPALIPPLGGQLNVRWEEPRWFAGAGTRFSGRQERTGDFEAPTAGYGIVNATAGLRLPVGRRLHLLTLRIDNLFDQEYREHLSRTKSVIPEAGRNVSLLYRLEF
jgi:iron complex outermembrane receptor protein